MPAFTLQNKFGEKIKIGVVHLCGGRFDEAKHSTLTVTDIKKLKTKVLKEMVEKYGADIILGDFNSDKTNSNIDYLVSSKGFNYDTAKAWNDTPYEYLESQGYDYIKNTQATSAFGGIPDMIWFKKSKLTDKQNFQLIDMNALDDEKKQFSDHNGLYAEFALHHGKDLSSYNEYLKIYPSRTNTISYAGGSLTKSKSKKSTKSIKSRKSRKSIKSIKSRKSRKKIQSKKRNN